MVAALGDRFMFQDYYGDRAVEQIDKDFGSSFAQALFQLKAGSWQGPIESGYGWHLIFIDTVTPSSSGLRRSRVRGEERLARRPEVDCMG